MEKRNVPKLRFEGFEDEWREYKLGNLCKISSGSTPSKLKREYFNGNIFWVTSGELKNKYLKDTIDKITESAKIDANLKIYDKGTVVIAIYGLEAQGTRGSSTILNTKATISQACMALEVNNKIINEYLYYWYEKYGEIIGLKYAQGTKQQNLSTNLVSELNVKLPSLEEQTKIANFLSNVDNIIEEQEGKVKDLEQYKKGMMQKIFKQEVRFKDENGGEYPEWEEKKIKQIGNIISGVGFSEKYQGNLNLQYKVFKVSDMNLIGNEKIMTISNNTISKEILRDMKTKIISGNSIIFAKVGAAIFLERKRIVKEPFLIDNNMMAINVMGNYKLEFVYYLLEKIRLSKYAQIGALPSYNSSDIGNIKIKLPCIEEQTKIANFLSNIDNIIEEEKKKLEDLKLWKKGLLQQMFV